MALNRLSNFDKILFDWGDNNYYVRNMFDIDSSGNIYYTARGSQGNAVWLFDTVRVSYDETDIDGVTPKMFPITHYTDTSEPITAFYNYSIGDIIARATYDPSETSVTNSARIGHVLGVNQKENTLLLNLNSKHESIGGALYVLDLENTKTSNYEGTTFTRFRSQSFDLPVIKDILSKYDDPLLPHCNVVNNHELDKCKVSSMEALDTGYSSYTDLEGKTKWVSFLGTNIFSMEQVDGEDFGTY